MRWVLALAAAMVPAGAGSAQAQPADWGVKRDPFDATVIARYRAILVKNPWDGDALAELVRMYKTYRTHEELQKLYDKPADWATAVVAARLAPTESVRWEKVLVFKDDGRAFRELADIERSTGMSEKALAHYLRAAQLATTDAATKKHALEWVAHLAEEKQDLVNLNWAYDELIKLEPKDGKHWVDRGLSMQKLNHYADAIDNFAKAEALMQTDPQGKLDVIVLRARAMKGSGDFAGALTQYDRVLKLAPRGYYLGDEAITELIDLHTSDGTITEFQADLEKRWPIGTRGHFEWKTLASIYEHLGDTDNEITYLKKAVAAAPSELDTQTKLIEMLDATGKTDEALAQLDVATRSLPGNQELHVQLATRYHDAKDTKNAIATLQRLSAQIKSDARVHQDLVELFTKWHRPGLALHELEEVARIEPEGDNLVALGEAYWTGGNEQKALATWKKLGADPDGLARLGQVYVDHELYTEAIATYTQGVKLAPKNAELWRARAEVQETMSHFEASYADLQTAAALIKGKSLNEGHTVRYQLIRLLSRWSDAEAAKAATTGDGEAANSPLNHAVTEWTRNFNATPPDLESGYLLAEYEGRSPGPEQLAALERLHELVPSDLGVQQTLSRTYKILHRYPEAIAELKELAVADPEHAADYNDQIVDLNKRIEIAKQEGWTDENIADPDAWLRAHKKADPIEPFRLGLRMGVGSAMRGPSPHSVLVGAYTSIRIAHKLAFIGRFDWNERGGDMSSVKAAAISTGIAYPLLDLRNTVITVGAADRMELRVGDHMGWDRLGLAGDFTIEVIPKKMPGSLGFRFEQGLSDHGQSTALLLELGIGN